VKNKEASSEKKTATSVAGVKKWGESIQGGKSKKKLPRRAKKKVRKRERSISKRPQPILQGGTRDEYSQRKHRVEGCSGARKKLADCKKNDFIVLEKGASRKTSLAKSHPKENSWKCRTFIPPKMRSQGRGWPSKLFTKRHGGRGL